MITALKPIETRYQGYRFRSRLEARWAVFFDALGIRWEYEAQGYEIDMGDKKAWWLPDFWLPEEELLVEVKGEESALLKDREIFGYAVDFGALPARRGLLLLGSVPIVQQDGYTPVHSVLQCDKGVVRGWARLIRGWNQHWTFDIAFDEPTCSIDYDLPKVDIPFLGPAYIRALIPLSLMSAYTAARAARFEHGETP